MEISIYGTKRDFTVFYPTPTPSVFYSFARDFRRLGAVNDHIFYGKGLYSIAGTTNGGCIFTKYVFIRDGNRNSLGFLGFSVYVLNNNKLEGVEVKALLDGLAATYCQNYCPDFQLGNRQEDWLLFTSLANQYDSRLRRVDADDIENLQSGSQDAAFVYYSDAAELQRYFDDPYQDEYTPYRQILFVDNALKDKPENPLNALIHSRNDLTGKIDLDNTKYKLLFNEEETGLKIRVSVNGIRKASRNNIRRKSRMEITYSQAYRNSSSVSGTFQEIFARYPQYIAIDEQNRTITIKPFELQKETKSVNIVVTDRYGKQLFNPRITCINNRINKVVAGGQITFEGDEIGYNWDIQAYVNGYKEEEKRYRPSDNPENEIVFTLQEQKIIEIQLVCENNVVNDECEISVNRCYREVYRSTGNSYVFVGDEIDKKWDVEIKSNIYETKRDYYIKPRDVNGPVQIKLERQRIPFKGNNPPNATMNIAFRAGKHGKVINYNSNQTFIVQSMTTTSLIDQFNPVTKPDLFYKFKKWSKQKEKGGDKTIYEAQFELNKKMISIISTIVLATIAIMYYCFNPPNPPESDKTIEKYVQGDEFTLKQLKNLQDSINNNEPKIKETGGSWLSIIIHKALCKIGICDTVKPDPTKYNEWKKKKQILDEAIEVRTSIDKGNLCDSVVKNYDYSGQQSKFREAIGKIYSSNKCQEVSRKLDEISSLPSLPLSQIADSINSFLTQQSSQENGEPGSKQDTTKSDKKDEKKVEPKEQSAPTQSAPKKEPTPPTTSAPAITEEIIQYLRGSELKKETLKEYKQKTKDNSIRVSIDMILEFWQTIKDNGMNKDASTELFNKINGDKHLRQSELCTFLSAQCKDSKTFKKYNDTPGKLKCTTLRELINKIETNNSK